MRSDHARQIADLLNEQNQLVVHYTADRVLQHEDNYLVRLDQNGQVIACAELKRVQWYQFELLHVTVAQQVQRQGHARSLMAEAATKAAALDARILQSTIRSGNTASEKLFESSGFQLVSRFYNARSEHLIGVWQRVLSPVAAN